MQREDLLRIMDLVSLKEQHARTLLIHHRWDVEKVLAVLVEYGKDRLFAEAGITVVENDDVSSSQSSSFSCNICFDDVSPEEVTTMDCGHYFCNSCKYVGMNILLLWHPFGKKSSEVLKQVVFNFFNKAINHLHLGFIKIIPSLSDA